MKPVAQIAGLLVVVEFLGLTVDFADAHAFAAVTHEFAQFTNAKVGDFMHTNQ